MSRPRFASLSRGSTQMNPWNGFFEIVRTTSTQGGTKSCTRFSLASDTGALGPAQVRLTIAPSDSRSPRGASVPRADCGQVIGRARPTSSRRGGFKNFKGVRFSGTDDDRSMLGRRLQRGRNEMGTPGRSGLRSRGQSLAQRNANTSLCVRQARSGVFEPRMDRHSATLVSNLGQAIHSSTL